MAPFWPQFYAAVVSRATQAPQGWTTGSLSSRGTRRARAAGKPPRTIRGITGRAQARPSHTPATSNAALCRAGMSADDGRAVTTAAAVDPRRKCQTVLVTYTTSGTSTELLCDLQQRGIIEICPAAERGIDFLAWCAATDKHVHIWAHAQHQRRHRFAHWQKMFQGGVVHPMTSAEWVCSLRQRPHQSRLWCSPGTVRVFQGRGAGVMDLAQHQVLHMPHMTNSPVSEMPTPCSLSADGHSSDGWSDSECSSLQEDMESAVEDNPLPGQHAYTDRAQELWRAVHGYAFTRVPVKSPVPSPRPGGRGSKRQAVTIPAIADLPTPTDTWARQIKPRPTFLQRLQTARAVNTVPGDRWKRHLRPATDPAANDLCQHLRLGDQYKPVVPRAMPLLERSGGRDLARQEDANKSVVAQTVLRALKRQPGIGDAVLCLPLQECNQL